MHKCLNADSEIRFSTRLGAKFSVLTFANCFYLLATSWEQGIQKIYYCRHGANDHDAEQLLSSCHCLGVARFPEIANTLGGSTVCQTQSDGAESAMASMTSKALHHETASGFGEYPGIAMRRVSN